MLELSKVESGIAKKTKQQHGAMKVCLKLEVSGPAITIQQSETVALALQQRHPILRCRLHEQEGSLVLQEDPNTEIPVQELAGGFEAVWAGIEKVPIGLNDPLLRIILSPEDSVKTDVLFICHHAFCDGKSISALANDFMCLLAAPETQLPSLGFGPSLEVATSRTIGTGIVRSVRHAYRVTTTIMNVLRIPAPCTFPVRDTDISPIEMSRACSTMVNYLDFDQDETRKLLHVCRQHSTTITGALAAAIADSVGGMAAADGDFVALGCGLDMRPLYSPKLSPNVLCYQVGGTSILWRKHQAQRSSMELWTMARQFRQEIVQSIDSGNSLAVTSLIADLTYNSPPTFDMKISASLSNWGVLPFQTTKYGPWGITDARPAVNMAYLRLPVFLATTACEKLTVTLLAPHPAYDRADIQNLLQAVNVRIRAMLTT